MSEARQPEDLARTWGHMASDAFRASAAYFRSLPEDAWGDPTGCADWDERTLAGHIAGEAVWYPNMLNGIINGAPPHPATLYAAMKEWSPARLHARIDEAADELRAAIDQALPQHVHDKVNMGWAEVSLWRSTYVILMEGVYHDWDTRAGRDPQATIPAPWALELAQGITFPAPMIAHRDAVAGASGRYLLEVGDGVGPITVVADGDDLTVEKGAHSTPDVTLHLSPDQCVRLMAGRFMLVNPMETGAIRVEGDRDRVAGLNRIFGGIANG